MSKRKKDKTIITVIDKEVVYEDLTDEQKVLLNHINDLNRKIETSKFNLEQLTFGQNAFVNTLSKSLP